MEHHLRVIALRKAGNEGVSVYGGAGGNGFFPGRVFSAHHHILEDGSGEEDGLLS